MDLFETRIKGKFAASGETFTMRLATEGSDSGAKVKDGLLTLTGFVVIFTFWAWLYFY